MSNLGQTLLSSHCRALEYATWSSPRLGEGCELTADDRRNLELARERIDALLNSQEKIHAAA